MLTRALFSAVLLLAIGQPFSAYAQCGDMTLCIKNPPFPPAPPTCTKYPNYCAFMPPSLQVFHTKEAPTGPGYSIQLDNLTKDQFQKVLSLLRIDKSKVEVPK